MIKYGLTAFALKCFSLTPGTAKLYRAVGNAYGSYRRLKVGLPLNYIHRGQMLLEILEKYLAIRDEARVLELGTGWVHWDSFFLRLLYDLQIYLYDVWDNRDFKALKRYIRDLMDTGKEFKAIFKDKTSRVQSLLKASLRTTSFEYLYELLGFEYVLDKKGRLTSFDDDSFDLVISDNVLEHVERTALQKNIKDIARILKPGGFSCHHIVLSDHLAEYDSQIHRKNYLRYSEKVWKTFFENKVQYINRVQSPEWLRLFRAAGFQLLENITQWRVDINKLKIAEQFRDIPRQDLECCGLNLLHRKPN